MRVYKTSGADPIELKLRDTGEFSLRHTHGAAPEGTVTEFEGTFQWKASNLTLNCQFKVTSRITNETDEEPTALRSRCRDVYTGVLAKELLSLRWGERTDKLRQQAEGTSR